MTGQSDVEQFLNQFKIKLKVFDMIYVGRSKNAQALLGMEWVPAARTKILENLKPEDYSEGPLEETIHGTGNMWVFGKEVFRKRDIYQNSNGSTEQQRHLHILSQSGTPASISV